MSGTPLLTVDPVYGAAPAASSRGALRRTGVALALRHVRRGDKVLMLYAIGLQLSRSF
jgi:hypothetical protein